jgi:two-component system chemotaxis response regulator CheB
MGSESDLDDEGTAPGPGEGNGALEPVSMPPLVAIGASTGGVEALRTVCAGLPSDLAAAVFLVLHVDSHPSILPRIVSRSAQLPADHALHGEPVVAGRIYVAPPDHHMTVQEGRVMLWRGPKEHHARPAVDPLFRSIASQGAGALGIVLTGDLSDGTQGLLAIRQAGGRTLVQNPDEAVAPGMPHHALLHGAAEGSLPVKDIPKAIIDWVANVATGGDQEAVEKETGPVEIGLDVDFHAMNRTVFVCPSCKGSLQQVSGSPGAFTCYTGHRFTLETLAHEQSQDTDEALWSAYRALCEKSFLLQLLAEEMRAHGQAEQASIYQSRSVETAAMAAEALGMATRSPGSVADRG